MIGVMPKRSSPIPAPLSPIVSSRPYGPPETEKKMMPTSASLCGTSRIATQGRSAGSSATIAMYPLPMVGVVYHSLADVR